MTLKGGGTVVTDGVQTHVNDSGSVALATAGSGDVLTGIIGGLLAQGSSVSNALVVGAHVHGLAGDLAAAELGGASLIATDVITKLPQAIHSLGAD